MKAYGIEDVQIYVFFTSALGGGEWSASRPGRFPLGKEPPVPIGYEAGWAPEPVWPTWRRENCCLYRDSNSDPFAVQPVASHYTDCAIPPHALEPINGNI
jgi:hypothetical protein